MGWRLLEHNLIMIKVHCFESLKSARITLELEFFLTLHVTGTTQNQPDRN